MNGKFTITVLFTLIKKVININTNSNAETSFDIQMKWQNINI